MSTTRIMLASLSALIKKLAALELPPDVHELRAQVEREFGPALNGDVIFIPWSVEDVNSELLESAEEFTLDEAREILQKAERRHENGVGLNWDTLRIIADETKKTTVNAKAQREATAGLEAIAKELAHQFPEANVTFGYIGNLQTGGWDDRGWRFFYNPITGRPCESFGNFSTDRLPEFLKFMQEIGTIRFSEMLTKTQKKKVHD